MSAKEQLLELLKNADEEMMVRMQEALMEFYRLESEGRLPLSHQTSE